MHITIRSGKSMFILVCRSFFLSIYPSTYLSFSLCVTIRYNSIWQLWYGSFLMKSQFSSSTRRNSNIRKSQWNTIGFFFSEGKNRGKKISTVACFKQSLLLNKVVDLNPISIKILQIAEINSFFYSLFLSLSFSPLIYIERKSQALFHTV